MTDLGNEEYSSMVCVEPAAAEIPITLKPDEEQLSVLGPQLEVLSDSVERVTLEVLSDSVEWMSKKLEYRPLKARHPTLGIEAPYPKVSSTSLLHQPPGVETPASKEDVHAFFRRLEEHGCQYFDGYIPFASEDEDEETEPEEDDDAYEEYPEEDANDELEYPFRRIEFVVTRGNP